MHSHAEFDWDDLRHFLAVARHGSTIQAAKALGMNQSTVQRRIAALERQLGRRLFDRCPEGYRLTRLGEELRPIAERVETDISDFSRQSASSHTELVGTIRVTCPETAGYRRILKLGALRQKPRGRRHGSKPTFKQPVSSILFPLLPTGGFHQADLGDAICGI